MSAAIRQNNEIRDMLVGGLIGLLIVPVVALGAGFIDHALTRIDYDPSQFEAVHVAAKRFCASADGQWVAERCVLEDA